MSILMQKQDNFGNLMVNIRIAFEDIRKYSQIPRRKCELKYNTPSYTARKARE